MKKLIPFVFLLALLLTGCSWGSGPTAGEVASELATIQAGAQTATPFTNTNPLINTRVVESSTTAPLPEICSNTIGEDICFFNQTTQKWEFQQQKSTTSTVTLPTATVSATSFNDSLIYNDLLAPNPDREPVFPNVPKGDRKALVAYEQPFEDGDYCEDNQCDVDIPQYYYRVLTAGQITIPQANINCLSDDETGCLTIFINHFGNTLILRNVNIDNGFTVAGRIFDMSEPKMVSSVAQALLDHYVGRMTQNQDGANCGTINACKAVQWHVIVFGNGKVQTQLQGVYTRPKN